MIVSSEIVEDAVQSDGRRWITERHTDQLGITYDYRYLADADTDVAAIMAARVPTIEADLMATEIATNLQQVQQSGPAAVLTFNYSTQPQSILAMAQQAGSLTPWQTVLLGQFLAALTVDQLTGLIGLTTDQIATLNGAVQGVAQALAGMGQVIAAIAAGAA